MNIKEIFKKYCIFVLYFGVVLTFILTAAYADNDRYISERNQKTHEMKRVHKIFVKKPELSQAIIFKVKKN